MALSNTERSLLKRCLEHAPGAWNDFVDRYLGLIYHVIHHTAHVRSVQLRPEDTEDLAADILVRIVDSDYAVLRQFRGESSLATYLTVIARRTCVNEMAKRAEATSEKASGAVAEAAQTEAEEPPKAQLGLENLEEVQKLLRKLPSKEREVVRLYYLEGRSYEEISTDLDIPVNSIGPVLSRARKKLRQDVKSPPAAYKGPPPKIQGE